jgi:excisionase family DNA binding protein
MDIAPRRLTVTVQQAAGLLGISVPTVWAMLHDQRLESIALNRRRLIVWESVEKLVESLRGVPGDTRRNGAVPPLGATNAKKKVRKGLDLSTPIEGLELSTRSKNALVNQGVKTVAQLVPHTEQELLKLPNLGGISLAEIKALLKRYGLRLGMEIPQPDRVAPPEPARREKARKDGADPR